MLVIEKTSTVGIISDAVFLPMVSMIPSCDRPSETTDVLLSKIFEATKNGKWEEVVEEGRLLKNDEKKYKNFKSYNVPAFTAHGTATYASNEGMKQHNELAFLDFDKLKDKERDKDNLSMNPYAYSVYDSFGGQGLVVVCKIPKVNNAEDFELYHHSLREYFLNEYSLIADNSARSFKNLRLVSYDPDLFLNEASMIWKSLPQLNPQRKKIEPKKENNHYADVLPYISKLGHNGHTDDEIRDRLKDVHIDPSSCLNNPGEIEKLIANIRNSYTAGKEGKGHDAVQYNHFWTNNNKNTEIQLSLGLLGEVLSLLGWRILDNEYILVSKGVIYKKTVTELYELIVNLVSFQEVTFKVKDFTFTVDRTTLKTKVQKELRGNIKIIALSSFEFLIQRDTSTETFFHFRNNSLRVTKEGYTLFERNAKEGVVWEDQLLPHNIEEDDSIRSVFAEFLMNASGPENYHAFLSAIGRALHNHNGSEGMRVPWFCDEQHKAGESNGRSGKSLITKAIGKCRKMDDCHGKDFKSDNNFKFQNVGRSTQVYCIDDVKDNFDFRALYNVTSEGMEYERKNKDRVRLDLQETPQLLITSNHAPQIEQGASTTGRLLIMPVKSFYQQFTDQGGVKAHHGHTFFDDWDSVEWNRFYWFMAVCAKHYLSEGYVFADQAEIRKNRLREICSRKLKTNEAANEFVEFVYSSLPCQFTLEDLSDEFEGMSLDKQGLAACLKSYFEIEKILFTKQRERIDGAQKTIWKVL
jgi:hypothetical protein